MEEKTAQEDYEELMADSAEKRAGDSKTITEKEAQKVYGFGTVLSTYPAMLYS